MYAGIIFNLAIILGPLVVLVIALYVLQKFWCMVLGRKAIYLTGWIGTPVHELSHVVMCVLFRHRVTEVSLFRPEPGTGVLGFVCHEYKRYSVYQRLGCFFIGLAPLAGNLGLAYLVATSLNQDIEGVWGFLAAAAKIYLIICLVLHAAPSPEDLRGATVGFGVMAVIFLIACYFFGEKTYEITKLLATTILNQMIFISI